MLGWLVVNGFLESKKFYEIYTFLKNAAGKFDIKLDIKTSGELRVPVGDDFSRFGNPDFVIFWDKDIYLAKQMEAAGLRLFNSAEAIEICDNKMLTALALSGKLPMPKTVFAPKTFSGVGYNDMKFIRSAAADLGFPMIIKETYGSFGHQVHLAHNLEEAGKIILSVEDREFLMQQFIECSSGRDVRVNVVGGRVVSSMMRKNENDFRSNISSGGVSVPYTVDKETEKLAVRACREIGLDFAGVDLLFGDNGKMLICEVNSNPHFKSSFDCNGIDMSLSIMEYISSKL